MKLLFVCTHNACRSILAEVITRALAGGRIEAASAGSHPAGRVHPATLLHLEQAGYASDGLSSKSFDDIRDFEPDAVVTVCDSAAGEPCPVWLGEAVKSHWGLPDPSHIEGSATQRSAAFESVMAIIRRRIETLLQRPLDSLDQSQLQRLLDEAGEQF